MNFNEKQRFSIRKYHFGATSVLLGSLMVLATGHDVKASQVSQPQASEQTTSVQKDNKTTAPDNTVTQETAQTADTTATGATATPADNTANTSDATNQSANTATADKAEATETQSETTNQSDNASSSEDKTTDKDTNTSDATNQTDKAANTSDADKPRTRRARDLSNLLMSNPEVVGNDEGETDSENPIDRLKENQTDQLGDSLRKDSDVTADVTNKSVEFLALRNELELDTIVSSDENKIPTTGYEILPLRTTPTLSQNAINANVKSFGYDNDPAHYVFAVVENYNERGNKIDGKTVATMSFAVNPTDNDGTVYVYYYDNQAEYLGETIVPKGQTTGVVGPGFVFDNKGEGLFAWGAAGSRMAGNTLYDYMQENPTYVLKGQKVGDKYAIPLKVTTYAKYYDKNHNLLGKVAITGMVGQHYKVPKTAKYGDLSSDSVSNASALIDGGDKYEGVLGDYQIGSTKYGNDEMYECVPGDWTEYYDVLPSPIGEALDETTAKLKDNPTPSNLSLGTVKVTGGILEDQPRYLSLTDTRDRYIGSTHNGGFSLSMYDRNPYAGTTPPPNYYFATSENEDVTQPTSQTVKYQGAGGQTPKDNVQDGYTFEGTKANGATTWTELSHTYGEVPTPVIEGYTADKATGGGKKVTPAQPDAEDTVTYRKNGKIIPVDEDGKPIPNAPTPTYTTDPNNPTKVTPDESVPSIDGWEPEVSKVTPTDPTKDTLVKYRRVKGNLVVNYIDESGRRLRLSEREEGFVGTEYQSHALDIPGYELIKRPDHETGYFVKGDTVLNYIYRKVETPVQTPSQTPTTPTATEQTAVKASVATQETPSNTLPETGEKESQVLPIAGALSVLSVLGLAGFKRRKKQD